MADARKIEWAKQEAQTTGLFLEEVLEKLGVSQAQILDTKSKVTGIPSKSLDGARVHFDVLKYVPEDSARTYKFAPLGVKEGVLEVGIIDPSDLDAREALQFIASRVNMPFRVYLISIPDYKQVLDEYKGLGGEVTKVLGELETALRDEIPDESAEKGEIVSAADKVMEDAPITKMVAVILKHATEGKASDIHIEPSKDKLRVRFRVDGVLHTSLILPMRVQESIIARIKILTNMQLDEKRKPQDGRFSARIDNRDIDFRVSAFPTAFGEKIAIRILDPEKGIRSLEESGLIGRNLKAVEAGLSEPYGMVLITGPTGSGKTTTLYSMLNELNQERYNIVSLEDPIEYNIAGVNQSQVRPEIGYDFASGLRSILRQDPDIIMVGEIRDRETAQLAIHAALTGHIVLSTLHTNSAIGVIPRLIDMGVEPYLIPPTLNLAIAQRLVRTLCQDSKKAMPLTGALKERIDNELKEISPEERKKIVYPKEIYQALPSATCPKGTSGRMAVFEVLAMSPELEKIILKSPTETDITAEARRQGMLTMREDGIMKVLQGKIGVEELSEVI
ncbi:MAG: type II secretion system protein E [Candidatus Giovannonibacteria bacterium GW2011_GWC2_44_8]|uniref:Type II secretion system protein E n=1 Tax=Candidatus Giovannonibacteria bacterium GW2011_GWC2_44_8 TaxID=1618657 RepID=A0A0G1K469_9BACT|nr:MAG: type II secretion system protein E [Candidatus Giovannonibacteria bacterium GW2011_GWC2_44_8]